MCRPAPGRPRPSRSGRTRSESTPGGCSAVAGSPPGWHRPAPGNRHPPGTLRIQGTSLLDPAQFDDPPDQEVLPFLSANRGRKEPLDRENPAVPHLKTEEPTDGGKKAKERRRGGGGNRGGLAYGGLAPGVSGAVKNGCHPFGCNSRVNVSPWDREGKHLPQGSGLVR